MAKNNHFVSSNDTFCQLDTLLTKQTFGTDDNDADTAINYARCISMVENVVAVTSDLCRGTSHIFAGAFASVLGIGDYSREDSIWEREILGLMSAEEQEQKFISELRFYHFLRHIPRHRRRNYYLVSKLRMQCSSGVTVDVLHRMYYIFDSKCETVKFAICLYGPMTFEFAGRSMAIDSLTGLGEELTASSDNTILSRREKQILALINGGLKSREIADSLCISQHTVNRHRQEILSKLQVRNSLEACRLAKSLNLI